METLKIVVILAGLLIGIATLVTITLKNIFRRSRELDRAIQAWGTKKK